MYLRTHAPTHTNHPFSDKICLSSPSSFIIDSYHYLGPAATMMSYHCLSSYPKIWCCPSLFSYYFVAMGHGDTYDNQQLVCFSKAFTDQLWYQGRSQLCYHLPHFSHLHLNYTGSLILSMTHFNRAELCCDGIFIFAIQRPRKILTIPKLN